VKIRAELTFPAELKEEPIIYYLCRDYNVILNILEASFSTDTGWAILILEGENEELIKAFNYIKEKGVKFESMQEVA
jgi:ABC-type methionine transport system ATPase subunit